LLFSLVVSSFTLPLSIYHHDDRVLVGNGTGAVAAAGNVTVELLGQIVHPEHRARLLVEAVHDRVGADRIEAIADEQGSGVRSGTELGHQFRERRLVLVLPHRLP
jgi:hypothetical protein